MENPKVQTQSVEEVVKEIERKRKNKRIIIGVIVIFLLIICAGCVIVGNLVRNLDFSFDSDSPTVEEFIQSMSDKDVDHAYGMLSTSGQATYSRADMNAMVDGIDFVLFEGFQDITITNFKSYSGTNGTYQQVQGMVNYQNQWQGEFYFILDKEDGEWKVSSFEITVPPGKVEAYLESNGN